MFYKHPFTRAEISWVMTKAKMDPYAKSEGNWHGDSDGDLKSVRICAYVCMYVVSVFGHVCMCISAVWMCVCMLDVYERMRVRRMKLGRRELYSFVCACVCTRACVYIYIYIYIHTYIHTYIYTYVDTCTYIRMHLRGS
jgi:hypothetical protein